MSTRSRNNITDSLLKKLRIEDETAHITVALSGGADSVCLTHLLHKKGIRISAAHFSHGIRPEEADKERAICIRLCEKLGIELVCGSGDTPAHAAENGIGLEEAARILRYDFLRKAASENGGSLIATAHHLNDNAETVLFNLIRGTGLNGLCGIPYNENGIIRPLLGITRDEIMEYVRENGLEYATDKTNFDTEYSRNLIRLRVMPLLRSINSRADQNITSAAELLSKDKAYIDAHAAELASGALMTESKIEADANAFASADPAVSGRAVQMLFEAAGIGPGYAGKKHIDAFLALCASSDPSGEIDLPLGMRASRSYDRISIRKQDEPLTPPREIFCSGPGEYGFGAYSIVISIYAGEKYMREDGVIRMPIPASSMPLLIRSRREGDCINGNRLKKLFTDRKIPRLERGTIPVVCSGNKPIACPFRCEKICPPAGADYLLTIRKQV